MSAKVEYKYMRVDYNKSTDELFCFGFGRCVINLVGYDLRKFDFICDSTVRDTW